MSRPRGGGKGSGGEGRVGAHAPSLPLTVEAAARRRHGDAILVVGIDEAGRGPLAGPVVAAAVAVPPALTEPPLAGIADSKTVTAEEDREAVYGELMKRGALYAASAVVEHDEIDRINILQATFRAMDTALANLVASLPPALAALPLHVYVDGPHLPHGLRAGVVGPVGGGSPSPPAAATIKPSPAKRRRTADATARHDSRPAAEAGKGAGAMVAGSDAPHPIATATPVVGGDGKVFAIAAASIVAKVTRDRLMHHHHAAWPQYGFAEHKGYGTPSHVAAIAKHGPCPIHRRTFAPTKHWYPPPTAAAEASSTTTSSGKASAKAASRKKAVGGKRGVARVAVGDGHGHGTATAVGKGHATGKGDRPNATVSPRVVSDAVVGAKRKRPSS